MKKNRIEIMGSPAECGAKIWAEFCNPMIRTAAKAMTPKQLSQMYAGMIMSVLGSMTADFSQGQAVEMAQTLLDSFAQMNLADAEKTH